MQVSPSTSMLTFEEIIQKTGWGSFHFFVIGLCSACAFTDGMATMAFPIITPYMHCDIRMTTTIISTINICLGLSTAIGGVCLCGISDIIGRRGLVNFTLIQVFIGVMISSVAYYYSTIIIAVLCLGAGISSNFNIIKIYLAEVLPLRNRGRCLVVVDFFFTLGYVGIIGLAHLLTQVLLDKPKTRPRLFTWRMIFGIIALCAILFSCTSALLLHGPRFLLYQKRYKQALDVLMEMFAINKSKHADYFSVTEAELHNRIHDFGINQDPGYVHMYNDRAILALKKLHRSFMLLFNRRFIKSTFLITFMKIFTTYGVLVLNIWLTKMLVVNSQCHLKGLDLLYFKLPDQNCESFDGGTYYYMEFLIIASSMAVGQLFLFLFIDMLGRKILISSAFIISGSSTVLLYFVTGYNVRLVFSCFIMMCFAIADSGLNVVLIESYPTAIRFFYELLRNSKKFCIREDINIRGVPFKFLEKNAIESLQFLRDHSNVLYEMGTASGQTQFLSRIALVILRYYLSIPCNIPFLFVGGSMIASSVLAWFLPNLSRKPMIE